MKFFLLFLTIFSFSYSNSLGQVLIDESFGDDGFLILASPADDYIGGIHIGDEFITVGSTITNDTGNFEVRVNQWNHDGTPNDLFGTQGEVIISQGIQRQTCSDITVQEDGKIIVVGDETSFQFGTEFLLFRMNTDGTLDNDFGIDGRVIIDFDGQDLLSGVIVEQVPNGKIYASGYSNTEEGARAVSLSVLSDGSMNTEYGESGIVQHSDNESRFLTKPSFGGSNADALVYGGHTTAGETTFKAIVFKVNKSDGTPDSSFGGNGNFLWSEENDDCEMNTTQLWFQGSTEHTYLGVTCYGEGDRVIKIYSDFGELVEGFGDGGVVNTNNTATAGGIAAVSGGRILEISTDEDGLIIITSVEQETGELDQSLSAGGIYSAPLPEGHTSSFAKQIKESPDGANYYAIGVMTTPSLTANQDIFIAKYIAPTTTVGVSNINEEQAIALYPNPFSGNRVTIESASKRINSKSLKVYDLLSNEVNISIEIIGTNKANIEFDPAVPAGIYFVHLDQDGGKLRPVKIIKHY